MKNKSELQVRETWNRQGGAAASKPVNRYGLLVLVAGVLAIFFLLCCGAASAQDERSGISPTQLRQFID